MDTFQPPPPLLPDLVSSPLNANDVAMTDSCSSGFQSNNSSAWPPATPCSSSSFTNMQTTITTFNDFTPQTSHRPPPLSPPQPAPIQTVGHQLLQPSQLPDIRPDKVVEEFEKIMSDENDRIVLTNSILLLYRFSIDNFYGLEVCQGLSASPIIKERLCFVLTNGHFKDDDVMLRYATGNLTNISEYHEGRAAILTFNGIQNNLQYRGVPSLAVEALFHSLQSRDIGAVIFAITAVHKLLLDRRDIIQEIAKQQIKHGLAYIVELLDNQCPIQCYKFKLTVLDCLQILAYGKKNNENRLAIKHSNGPYLLLRTIEENLNNDELIETASLVLKSLSVCRENKLDIIKFGGINTLTVCLTKNNHKILNTCLWTLRYLSDVINSSGLVDINSIEKLVDILLNILKKYPEEPCALGVLANLTCNNEPIKQFICANNGIYQLLETIATVTREARDVDLVIEILEPAARALSHLMNQNPNENRNIDEWRNIAWIIRGKLDILEASEVIMKSVDLAKAVEKLESRIQPYLTPYSS